MMLTTPLSNARRSFFPSTRKSTANKDTVGSSHQMHRRSIPPIFTKKQLSTSPPFHSPIEMRRKISDNKQPMLVALKQRDQSLNTTPAPKQSTINTQEEEDAKEKEKRRHMQLQMQL